MPGRAAATRPPQCDERAGGAGAVHALGIPLAEAAAALARFAGLKRRLETVGTAGGVTVIDDFAHNPDKIAATLATLTAQPGRLLIMFQPHGYGPLAKMGEELADDLRQGHARGRPALSCPTRSIRAGRSTGRAARIGWPRRSATPAAMPSISPSAPRSAKRCCARPLPGDRIAILGARDDTLSEFAAELVRQPRNLTALGD